MPTKDPDTKGRTGNLTETPDYIVSVTATSRLASEEYAYAPNQVAADGLRVLEANRRRFYRAHLPVIPAKAGILRPIVVATATGVLDSGLRRNDGGGGRESTS